MHMLLEIIATLECQSVDLREFREAAGGDADVLVSWGPLRVVVVGLGGGGSPDA